MKFWFKTDANFVTAFEYLIYTNSSYSSNESDLTIDLTPIGHDQLPIYDEVIVNKLLSLSEHHSKNDDELLAMGLQNNNVAR